MAADGSLKPIDFESAGLINGEAAFSWRTAAFSPPENSRYFSLETGESEDLYALGAVVYYLLTANFYRSDKPASINKLRRDVPKAARETIENLLFPDPRNRPAARDAIFE